MDPGGGRNVWTRLYCGTGRGSSTSRGLPSCTAGHFSRLKAVSQNLHMIKKWEIPVLRSLSKGTCSLAAARLPRTVPCPLPLCPHCSHTALVAVPAQRSCISRLTGGMGSKRGFRVGQDSPSPREVSGTVTALGCLQGGANLVCCCLHLCVYKN